MGCHQSCMLLWSQQIGEQRAFCHASVYPESATAAEAGRGTGLLLLGQCKGWIGRERWCLRVPVSLFWWGLLYLEVFCIGEKLSARSKKTGFDWSAVQRLSTYLTCFESCLKSDLIHVNFIWHVCLSDTAWQARFWVAGKLRTISLLKKKSLSAL